VSKRRFAGSIAYAALSIAVHKNTASQTSVALADDGKELGSAATMQRQGKSSLVLIPGIVLVDGSAPDESVFSADSPPQANGDENRLGV